jgi:hypothetical protein
VADELTADVPAAPTPLSNQSTNRKLEMTADDITALSIALQATPMVALSNMEVRTVLDWLKARGFLVKPSEAR